MFSSQIAKFAISVEDETIYSRKCVAKLSQGSSNGALSGKNIFQFVKFLKKSKTYKDWKRNTLKV